MNPIKKYYIYKDNQQKGPYSFEELKDLNISRDTMIWYEGLETWIKALEVEELKEIFKSIPSPIQTDKAIPPPYVERISNSNKDLKPVPIYKKKKSIIAIGVLLFFLITFGVITLYNKFTKQDEIVTKQDEIVIKQEDQNAKIKELEKIEASRNAEQLMKKRSEEAAQKQKELQLLNRKVRLFF
jgi:hypothetical protein